MINTREIAEEYRLSHWSQIMQERIKSGLSIKAYCKQIGICGNTYFYWQRKLREAACGQLALGQDEDSHTNLPSTHFAEIKVSESMLPEKSQQGQVRVEAAGVHITADGAYPTEKLATLLRELKRS